MIYKHIFKKMTYPVPCNGSLVHTRLSSLLVSHAAKIIAFTGGQTVAAREQVGEWGEARKLKAFISSGTYSTFSNHSLASCSHQFQKSRWATPPVVPTWFKHGKCISLQHCPLSWFGDVCAASWDVSLVAAPSTGVMFSKENQMAPWSFWLSSFIHSKRNSASLLIWKGWVFHEYLYIAEALWHLKLDCIRTGHLELHRGWQVFAAQKAREVQM